MGSIECHLYLWAFTYRGYDNFMSPIPFKEVLKVWIQVAIHSFGGPAGQIAVIHKLIVEEKKWIDEGHFLHALNYCMLLPGPEAQQLATYIGWLLHRIRGGLVAGTLFILPGFLSILCLSVLYAQYGNTPWVQAIFYGIKPAVLAIVIGAVGKIGKRALKNQIMMLLAAAAFVAIFFFNISFPYIILGAGLIGLVGGLVSEKSFLFSQNDGPSLSMPNRPPISKTVLTILVGLMIWFMPLIMVNLYEAGTSTFKDLGLFFSKTAVVTFGGAYSVLSYVAQQAVENYHWLEAGEMITGLAMAETTPGPLIQVVQFVGFMGAFRNPGVLDPLNAGIIASILVTWVTFVPCFLFIFAGAPYIEYLRGNRYLTTTLSAITAAVVGVILNLGLWFSLHTLFVKVEEMRVYSIRLLVPTWSSIDYAALTITGLACLGTLGLKWNMLKTIVICMTLGVIFSGLQSL